MSANVRESPAASSQAASKLLHPVETVAEVTETVTSTVRHAPGAPAVRGMVDGLLDAVGHASPRTRRFAAYAGAGLLGVVGVVEWPIAVAGAAAVWLTQSRNDHADESSARSGAQPSKARASGAHAGKSSGKTAGPRRTTAARGAAPATKPSGAKKTTRAKPAGTAKESSPTGRRRTAGPGSSSAAKTGA